MKVGQVGSLAPWFLLGALTFGVALLAPRASAQQSQPQADSSPPASSDGSPADSQSGVSPQSGTSYQTGTSNDRVLYALPNFLTLEHASQVPPLTAGQKLKTVTRESFDWFQYPFYGALAGIGQADNSERSFGQGAAGYGKRYASYFADGTIEGYMTGAILPSLLREDPRFYQSGAGGFWHRCGYAVSRIFVTRTDSGHDQFNFSEVLGSAISASISTNTYHPPADRTVANTASVWGSEVGYDTMMLVVKEFWPDIRTKLSHKPQPPETANAAP